MKKNFIALFWLLVFTPVAMAQPTMEVDDVLDNEVPFDGGVFLLVVAAVGYKLKELPAKRKVEPGKLNS